MDIFHVLTMLGGLSLFLFGMSFMGQALERTAGGKLRSLLGKMTTGKWAGLLTGLGITAVIQSSSATTVMVVGFVNSGLMNLRQAIHVIMGANVGTTVTAWILSLAGIDSTNVLVRLLKPSSFVPILALVGIVLYMFAKSVKKKDTGLILLGFATLMFGMETMSGAVSGLKNVPGFTNMFVLFTNPILGVLVGAILTAIIQSSSASVGILQALAVTGKVSYGAAIPIIMGQNIGTCITAILSGLGANKNAKRAAMVHLMFNVIGTAICLVIFYLVKWIVTPAFLEESASLLGIALSHTAFNLICTGLMLPLSNWLETIVCHMLPDTQTDETVEELDERLLATPPIALERCREVAIRMARTAVDGLKGSLSLLMEDLNGQMNSKKRPNGEPEREMEMLHEEIQRAEDQCDHYEDILGTYLVKLSTRKISTDDSIEAAKLLRMIGDLERISDHAVELSGSAGELMEKKMVFSEDANKELSVIIDAVGEAADLMLKAFVSRDEEAASMVEPLDQVIDTLKEQLRTNHILRLQQEKCSIELGFVWADLLTNLERVADHCSNIAGCMMELSLGRLMPHESVRAVKQANSFYQDQLTKYEKKYALK